MAKDEKYVLAFIFFAKRKGLFFSQKSDEGQGTLHHCVAMPSQRDGIHSHVAEGEKAWMIFIFFYTTPGNNEHNFGTYSDCLDPDTCI